MPINKKEADLFKKEFGLNLKKIREDKSMSQLDLASLVNVDKTSISRIENGRTNITIITALKLSNALDVKLRDLFDFNSF